MDFQDGYCYEEIRDKIHKELPLGAADMIVKLIEEQQKEIERLKVVERAYEALKTAL